MDNSPIWSKDSKPRWAFVSILLSFGAFLAIMYRFVPDANLYFVSLLDHTFTLLAGCGATVMLGLLQKYVFKRPLSLKWELAILAAFVFFAGFEAWRDQLHSVNDDGQQIKELKAKLDDLTLPQLQSGKMPVNLSWTGDKEQDTLITVAPLIKNKGAPTVLDNWEIGVEFDDGRRFQAQLLQAPLPNDTLTFDFPDKWHKVILEGRFWLPFVTQTDAVTPSHAARGWMSALVKHLNAQELIDKQAVVVVRCKDVNGKPFEMREKLDSASPPVINLNDLPGAVKKRQP